MYYFSEINIRGNHAGTKARNDVEEILKNSGAIPINKKPLILKSDENEHIYSNIKNRLDFINYFFMAKILKNKQVFIQYPILAFDKDEKYIKTLSKKNKIIFLVHDIHSLRRGDNDGLLREIKILNLADSIIVHNHFMKEILLENGLKVKKIYNLEIFDYLCFLENKKDVVTKEADIVFAGNLSKSIFLPALFACNKNVFINLYGIGWKNEWKKYENVKYIGNFNPDEIPSKLRGKYGLVWDGDSVKNCSGLLGEYIKINNPHKFSLYIAAGLPVIVWDKSAIAEYVTQYNIGIVLNTLTDLKVAIDNVSSDEYLAKCMNVKKLQNKIIKGQILKEILSEIQTN